MKVLLSCILFFSSFLSFGQAVPFPEDSLKEYEGNVVPIYTAGYMHTYNRLKRMIVKVYPYALYAADVIDEIDKNAESIQRRRKRNKFYKQSYKELKDNFKYFILDLYTSEGAMLMKLIHRETGMTVYDISLKYRGKQKAGMFSLMAKMWDQDLQVKFDPDSADKIAEHVIKDIQSGHIAFDNAVVPIDKISYQEKKEADKKRIKANRKKNKAYRKDKKKKEKALKKAKRKEKHQS